MLEIKNLKVKRGDSLILDDVSIEIEGGEIVALMGPNGSGKSTLSNVIMGHPAYEVVGGDILFEGESILEKSVDERAKMGLFMVFQSPRVVEGVQMRNFLYTIHKEKELHAMGVDEKTAKADKDMKKRISLPSFKIGLGEKTRELKMSQDMIARSLNEGFSGGEKKKGEILQMAVLKPKLSILDELDSGLDVDTLRIMCEEVVKNKEVSPMGLLVITHYPRIFDYLKPDRVYVLADGKVLESGGVDIAHRLEKEGFKL